MYCHHDRECCCTYHKDPSGRQNHRLNWLQNRFAWKFTFNIKKEHVHRPSQGFCTLLPLCIILQLRSFQTSTCISAAACCNQLRAARPLTCKLRAAASFPLCTLRGAMTTPHAAHPRLACPVTCGPPSAGSPSPVQLSEAPVRSLLLRRTGKLRAVGRAC
jgi:hypothetical protein